MTEFDRETRRRLSELFMPYAMARQERAKSQKQRFVYYTSADTALQIIRNKEFWMRHAASMNDFLEIEYGLAHVEAALKSDSGQHLLSALDTVHPGVSEAFLSRWHDGELHFRHYTYIACVSEHDPSEDIHGRLSMWRAYGGASSVAIVMNGGVFFSESAVLKAYTSPVTYWETARFEQEMATLASNVEQNLEIVRLLSLDRLRDTIFNVCKFGVLCSKHPGFAEEREWRVVHSPTFQPSSTLIKERVTIDGTPQTIYKILLKDVPEEGFIGAEIPTLIDRIIIGPMQFPTVAAEAFAEELVAAGVPDGSSRVYISGIPLRR